MGLQFRKGDLVEYTEEYQYNYTIGDDERARYGVVVEDTGESDYLRIDTPQGIISIPVYLVCTSGWIGWIPESVVEIVEKYERKDKWEDSEEWM